MLPKSIFKLFIFSLFVNFFTYSGKALSAETITLVSDIWCPYTCESHSKLPGFMIEIGKEVFENAGYKVDHKTLNWPRAIIETREGKHTAIVGGQKTDAPDFVYPSVAAGFGSNYFWSRVDANWKYENIGSIKNKKIGVINGYAYGVAEIDNAIAKRENFFSFISGDDAFNKIIKMTAAKRLDGFIENAFIVQYLTNTMPEYKNQFKIVSKNMAQDTAMQIAFSPKNPNSKKYAQILSDGITKIRKNGKLKGILAKYGLSDWEK